MESASATILSMDTSDRWARDGSPEGERRRQDFLARLYRAQERQIRESGEWSEARVVGVERTPGGGGRVREIAVVTPFELGGVEYRRVPLAFSQSAQELGLLRGDTVLLTLTRTRHGGDPQPFIGMVLKAARDGTQQTLPEPLCPSCGTPLLRFELRCPNVRYCPGHVVRRLARLSGSSALNLRALGSEGAEALLQAGVLRNEKSLFELSDSDLRRVDLYATVRARDGVRALGPRGAQLLAELERAREFPYARILRALWSGLEEMLTPRLGVTQSWAMARAFPSVGALMRASPQQVADTVDLSVPQAHFLRQWLRQDWQRDLVLSWEVAGVRMSQPHLEQTLDGVTIRAPRRRTINFQGDQLTDLVYGRGGRLASDDFLDTAVDYVLLSDVPDEASRQVHEAGDVPTITAEQLALLATNGRAALQPASGSTQAMWEAVQRGHPYATRIGRRGPLPTNPSTSGPGALYICNRAERQIVVVVATSLAGAIAALEQGTEVVGTFARTESLWAPGSVDELRRDSPLLKAPANALRRGRPILVRGESDWARVPHKAGIYRIHLMDTAGPSLYVGRSQDLRVRPRHHNKTAGLPWSDGWKTGVLRIELLPVKGPQSLHAWTVTDLDQAEADMIRRAQERFGAGVGPRVLNATSGRNGPPSRPRSTVYVWAEPEEEAFVQS